MTGDFVHMSDTSNPLDKYLAQERKVKELLELSRPLSERFAELGLSRRFPDDLMRRSITSGVDFEVGRLHALESLAKRMDEATKPLATIAANTKIQNAVERIQAGMLGVPDYGSMLGGRAASEQILRQIESMSRVTRVIDGLTGTRAEQLAGIIGGPSSATAEITRMVDQLVGAKRLVGDDILAAFAGPNHLVNEGLSGITSTKLSTFAGSLATLGPESSLTGAAFTSLMGEWQTKSDLPSRFWRDASYRRDMYREADIDPWLIEAGQADTIALLVDSGFVEGRHESGSVTAVLEFGEVRLEITASRTRARLQQAIDHFELQLRAFIAEEMEKALRARGEDTAKWFIRRVPGPVVKQAKETRQAAIKSGESHAALIHFTNLGDLLQIMVRSDNWEEVFAPVFGDQGMFRSDLERLVASRRPAMHARPVDATRLVEALLVMQRLQAGMAAWRSSASGAWDDDV
jgi:hypothetical protein